MESARGVLAGARRRPLRRYLVWGVGVAAAGYAAYRIYNSEALAAGKQRLEQLRKAVAAYGAAFGTGADTLQLLLGDLHAFLQSDRSEVPASLRQLARLMQSPEVAGTTSATVAALIRGVSDATSGGGGQPAAAAKDGSSSAALIPAGDGASAAAAADSKPALDRILEALLSDRGHSLVSVAVSLGARNLVTGYCEAQHRLAAVDRAAAAAAPRAAPTSAAAPADTTARLLDFLASPRGQQLAVLTVTAFVSNGMRAYLDQTLDLNFYEDLFAAMAKPEHLDAVKQCVGVFARDVVGAYLAGPTPPPQQQQQQQAPPSRPQLRLSTSIHELFSIGSSQGRTQQAASQQQQQQGEELPADTGSPTSSTSGASIDWEQRHAGGAGSAPHSLAPAAPSEVDSDVLLHPQTAAAAAGGKDGGAGGDSARSHEAWAVRTPQPAGAPQPVPVLPQVRRVQQQGQEAAAAGSGMQRQGSGNLELISAIGKEWLNVAQNPHGRTVMVELAGTAAKEAARGMSAALADRFRMEWLLVAAFAVMMLAWLMQRMLSTLLG